MSRRDKWKKFTFSLDLVGATPKLLEFLKYVDSRGRTFYEPELVKKAAYRYEKYWLPLYASLSLGGCTNDYYPPYDVAWIWHCHLLAPTSYIKDCRLVCAGQVLDHFLFDTREIESKQERTRELWERELAGVAFNFGESNSIRDENEFRQFRSKLSYNLIEASQRQQAFYYQVSLPHFSDVTFLRLCLQRYRKFLYLKQKNPMVYVVPCYGIDLIWHAPQLSPMAYAKDTVNLLGYVFPHDDTTNDRAAGSKLTNSNVITRDLWMGLFGEAYFFPGGMYRGDKPSRRDFTSGSRINFRDFYAKRGQFCLVENRLSSNGLKNEKTKFQLKVTNSQQVVLYEGVASTESTLSFNKYYDYDQLDEKSLDITVAVVRPRESLGEKLKNVLGKKRDLKSFDGKNEATLYSLMLKTPLQTHEWQEFKMNLTNSNESCGGAVAADESSTFLYQKWSFDSQAQRAVLFDLKRQPFQFVHMKHVVHDEYACFDMANRDFSERKGEGIRAAHILRGYFNNEKIELYRVEILHVPSIKWSSIKLTHANNQLLASAHLIGPAQLPTRAQIRNARGLYLNPEREMAMLIRNHSGDYAVVKGEWVGVRCGVPPKYRGQKGVRGNAGRLLITIYSFEKKKQKKLTISGPEFVFELKSSDNCRFKVDLKTGRIVLKLDKDDHVSSLEIESTLCVIFSIAMLHVMAQPKPKPYVSDANFNENPVINPAYSSSTGLTFYRGLLPVNSIDLRTLYLLSSIGLLDLIGTFCFYYFFCNLNEVSYNSWFFGGSASGDTLAGCGGCGGCGGGTAQLNAYAGAADAAGDDGIDAAGFGAAGCGGAGCGGAGCGGGGCGGA
jgi:hypothetical protein